jgi:hypothetical protein
VPGSVEYLLVEVQTVHADLVLLPLSARTHLQGKPLINQSAAPSTINQSISCSINH